MLVLMLPPAGGDDLQGKTAKVGLSGGLQAMLWSFYLFAFGACLTLSEVGRTSSRQSGSG